MAAPLAARIAERTAEAVRFGLVPSHLPDTSLKPKAYRFVPTAELASGALGNAPGSTDVSYHLLSLSFEHDSYTLRGAPNHA